jgi:ElaB/YqjD/DUF883 family membrane-anchored ribosome-binding protein
MTPSQRVAAAERQVETARMRLTDTIQALADELEPKKLMRELWEDAKVKGADLAEEAVDAVKSRPIAATGIAAVIGLFLAREPIIEATGRFLDGREAKKKEKKRRKTAAKPVSVEPKPTEKSDERSERK